MEELDEVVELKDNVHMGFFQMEILKGRVTKPSTNDIHIMSTALRHLELESGKACPLPPGLQVLHAYMTLAAGNKIILIVVQHMSDSPIFLRRGVHIAHVVMATLVLLVELTSGEEATMSAEAL